MIYTITRFRHNPFSTKENNSGSTVGYYADEETAKNKVENNTLDLNEAGYYPFVVIEEFAEGIHKESWKMFFYKFNRSLNKYVVQKAPKNSEITNFAMG